MTVTPFRIDVPDATLADLKARLRRSRFSDPTRPGWEAGADAGYLRDLAAYWAGEFDWRAAETRINQFPQWKADVDGSTIHFVHITGSGGLPLVLTHGWPSSFLEFLPLIPLLRDRFDLVIPSIPGFGYSSRPPGYFTRKGVATTWHRLMTEVLGYERYGAFGGDIGSGVTRWLGIQYPEHVAGVHFIHPPGSFDADDATDAERAFMAQEAEYDLGDQGYSEIMWTRPDTIGAALIDSPIGLAAWIADKLRDWSDCGGDLSRRFDLDAVATLSTLYWVTDSIGSSFQQYFDYPHNTAATPLSVPVGVTLAHEPSMNAFPRSATERICADLRHWNAPQRGGHFLAFEEPELMAGELTTFFGSLDQPSSPG
jgi:pimeloyl-ACP methyl ester carboxylesterase